MTSARRRSVSLLRPRTSGPSAGLHIAITEGRTTHSVRVTRLPEPSPATAKSMWATPAGRAKLQSLESRNYPVLRIDLGDEPEAGWQALSDSIDEALR